MKPRTVVLLACSLIAICLCHGCGGTIIYRSGQNPKIQRNFEVFTPCDFIAAITQHIPDKCFLLVRYYGWYSNSRPKGDGLPEVAATKRSGVATCAVSATNRPVKRPRPPATR